MKKITLIIILAILISLAVITPVLAKGGGDCPHPSYQGYFYGIARRNYHADGRGYFMGPWIGQMQACRAAPPKVPYWAQ